MTDTQQTKPAPAKAEVREKTLVEIPGSLKIGLVSEPEVPQAPSKPVPTGALLLAAAIAITALCGLFAVLGRKKRPT